MRARMPPIAARADGAGRHLRHRRRRLAARSTSRRSRRSWSRRAACAVAKHGNRALSSRSGSPTCSRRSACDPAPGPALVERCLREARHRLPVRARVSTPPPATRPARARSSACAHLQPARAADQPGGRRATRSSASSTRERVRARWPRARRARARSARWWCTARAASTRSPPAGATRVAELDGRQGDDATSSRRRDFGLADERPGRAGGRRRRPTTRASRSTCCAAAAPRRRAAPC